jgi:pimeloyl-ACP methyl ester carboxylesterase
MPKLDRNGVKIHYEEHGSGTPVLLSHGYSATSRMWNDQVAALKDHYRVITWDMRGHGQSDYPESSEEYSERHTVDDMAAILRALRIERAVIGGLSLGGVMSLGFHAAYPAMTGALMLFDTGPGFRNPEARRAWNEQSLRRAEQLESRGLAALGRSDEVRLGEHRSADGLARAARGMLTQTDDHLIRSLPGIAVPTLVLVGSEDTNFLAATDYMAAKIPNAVKIVIPNAGHAANLHQPEAFNRALTEFLGTLPAG